MTIIDKWYLRLTTDQVLRAQGADPVMIQSRRPALIRSTEEAMILGRQLIHPKVLFRIYEVKRFTHERIELSDPAINLGKQIISGTLISQHLARADKVIVILCTVGGDLDNVVSSLFATNPTLAVALDGVGSAAVELLAVQACNYFESLAKDDGLNTSLPLNPGMLGWPVEVGQPQIFSLLDSEEIDVTITESCMMIPNKSLSMLIGIGRELLTNGSTCDYCSLLGKCKYQNHYAKQA